MAIKKCSPKKRTKQNCKVKRATNMARYATSDLLLVFVGGIKETHALDKKTGSPVDIGPSIAQSLHSVPFKWHVYLAVFCKTQTGEYYIQSEEMNFQSPYRRSLISDMLNKAHDTMIRKRNPQHILNIGWIASTVPYEFDDRHCEKLFNQQGAWNYLAEWEKEKVINEAPKNPKCPKCHGFVKKQDYLDNCAFGRPCERCVERAA